MVDIQTNNKGLTYTLTNYAKEINGGKDVKLNSKKWQNVMKLVAEFNEKRNAENKIFSGGSNLFGKANENFVITKKTITFSENEIALILKEMGIETSTKKDEFMPVEDFKIKGLSIERSNTGTRKVYTKNDYSFHPDYTDIPLEEYTEQPPKTIHSDNNEGTSIPLRPIDEKPKYTIVELKKDIQTQLFESKFQQQEQTNIKEQLPNEYFKSEDKNLTTTVLSNNSIVHSAKDTTELTPPFKIATPIPGKRGGGTKTISEQFHKRAMAIADKIGCKYEDLITVMNFESGIDPTSGIKNPRRRPVGLLQFTETGIRGLNKTYGLNLTKEKILQMNEMEQLELVEKYFEMTKKEAPRLRNKKEMDAADLYTLTLLPARAGRDELCRADEKDNRFYRKNKGIDVGGDGIITRADVLTKLDEFRINIQVV